MFIIIQWYGTWLTMCLCAYLIAGEIHIWRSRYMRDIVPLFFRTMIVLCLTFGSVGIFLMFLTVFGSDYWQVEIKPSNWLGLIRMYMNVSVWAVTWLIMRIVNHRAVRRSIDDQEKLREVLRILALSKERRAAAEIGIEEAQSYLVHYS